MTLSASHPARRQKSPSAAGTTLGVPSSIASPATEARLKANSLSFFENVTMGVAGSAPGFSIAVTLSTLLATAGTLAPSALVIFALPMLGIAMGYKGLNAHMPAAGAAYEWTSRIFNDLLGFFSGWALLVASVVFVVAGCIPLGAATLSFFPDPGLANNTWLTTLVGASWFVAIGLVIIGGMGLVSAVQLIMSGLELLILSVVAIAALVHAVAHGAIATPSWSWLGQGYTPKVFSASALIVVFFYWGWDVTSNLGEEAVDAEKKAGQSGVLSIAIIVGYFVAFAVAALMLFQPSDVGHSGGNLIYGLAIKAGLGRAGGLAASFAVILSSVATLETSMLQFSRTVFAMGRDRALPAFFGVVKERTGAPQRAIALMLVVGLAMVLLSNLMASMSLVLADAVRAVAIQVCYYYSFAGFASAWLYRAAFRTSLRTFAAYAVYPALSAVALVGVSTYAVFSFDVVTTCIGVGGLAVGVVFYRRSGYPLLERPGALKSEQPSQLG